MLKYLRIKYIIAIGLLSFLFVSCAADIDLNNISNDNGWNSALIVPLGDAQVNMGDLVMNSRTSGDAINIIDGQICYQSVDSSFFSFRDIDLIGNSKGLTRIFHPSSSTITYPAHSSVPTLTSSDSLQLGINKNISSERVDSVVSSLARIQAEIQLSSDLTSIRPSDVTLTILFSDGRIRKMNGSSSTLRFTPTNFSTVGEIIMTDFVFNASVGIKAIPIKMSVDVKTNNVPVTFHSYSTVTCKLKVTQLNYSILYGYFEPDIKQDRSTVRDLSIRDKFTNGEYRFMNPQIEITNSTNIGTYIGVQVDSIRAYVKNDPSFKPIYAWFNGHTTNSTSQTFDTKPLKPGNWVSSQMKIFDKDWGETYQLFDATPIPDVIEYRFSFFTNGALISSDPTPSFITPDGIVKIKTKTTIPLYMNSGSYFLRTDTIDNIYKTVTDEIDKYGKVDHATLVIKAKNGLPIKNTLSIKLLDNQENEIQLPEDFTTSVTLESAQVNDNGEVIVGKETLQILAITFNNTQLDIAKKAVSLVYTLRAEGMDKNSKINVSPKNTFDLNLGFFVKGELKP